MDEHMDKHKFVIYKISIKNVGTLREDLLHNVHLFGEPLRR